MHNSTIQPEMIAYSQRDEDAPDDSLEFRVSLPEQSLYQSGLRHPELRVSYDAASSSVSLISAESIATNSPLQFSISGDVIILAALSKTDTGLYAEQMSEDWRHRVQQGYVGALGWLLLQANGVCVYFDPFGRPDECYTALQVASTHPIQIDNNKSVASRIGHVTKPIVRHVADGMPNANKMDDYFSGGRPTSGIFNDLYNN